MMRLQTERKADKNKYIFYATADSCKYKHNFG